VQVELARTVGAKSRAIPRIAGSHTSIFFTASMVIPQLQMFPKFEVQAHRKRKKAHSWHRSKVIGRAARWIGRRCFFFLFSFFLVFFFIFFSLFKEPPLIRVQGRNEGGYGGHGAWEFEGNKIRLERRDHRLSLFREPARQ